MSSKKLENLLSWCRTHNIRIDSRIELVDDGAEKGVCVVARNSVIPSYTSRKATFFFCSNHENDAEVILVVDIPKAALLSTRSCTLSNKMSHVPYGSGAHLALALALHYEL